MKYIAARCRAPKNRVSTVCVLNSFIFIRPLLTSRLSVNRHSPMRYRLLQIFPNKFSQHARHRHVNPSDARACHIVRLSPRATQSHLVKFRFFAHKAIDENLFRFRERIRIQTIVRLCEESQQVRKNIL